MPSPKYRAKQRAIRRERRRDLIGRLLAAQDGRCGDCGDHLSRAQRRLQNRERVVVCVSCHDVRRGKAVPS